MKLLNEFVVKGTPDTTTAQQKGVRVIGRRVMFYKKPEVVQAERWLWGSLLCFSPTEPYEGALYVRIMWLFDKKSLTKKEDRTFRIARPDLDNMFKGLADVMSDMGFWKDDSQIVKMDLTKGWSKKYPGLFFQIWQLEDGDYERLVDDWRNVEW